MTTSPEKPPEGKEQGAGAEQPSLTQTFVVEMMLIGALTLFGYAGWYAALGIGAFALVALLAIRAAM